MFFQTVPNNLFWLLFAIAITTSALCKGNVICSLREFYFFSLFHWCFTNVTLPILRLLIFLFFKLKRENSIGRYKIFAVMNKLTCQFIQGSISFWVLPLSQPLTDLEYTSLNGNFFCRIAFIINFFLIKLNKIVFLNWLMIDIASIIFNHYS